MVGSKQIFCVLLFTVLSGLVVAQNNTNSPYTRYGYGELSGQMPSNSKAMGGVAYGLRDPYHINFANPASYTVVDSLAFLFEGSLTLQNANFSNGSVKMNAKNSALDYLAMQFRLRKGLAVSAGLVPFSNVGYNFSEVVENTQDPGATHAINYYGNGGLHQVYLGIGANVWKNLSVGANVSYIWGDITRVRNIRFSSANYYNYLEATNMSAKDIKLDFGVQYLHRFNKKNSLTVGAVFSPKNNLKNDTYVQTQSSMVVQRDTVATFGIPNSFGIGFAYRYDERLMVGLDYAYQKWSGVSYMNNPNAFSDYSRISLGMEYLPNPTGTKFYQYIKYRFGLHYANPYYNIGGSETTKGVRASKEYGVSAGFSFPLPRSLSVINISGQYVKVSGQKNNFLDENYVRLNIGITFNERWFAKIKVQ